MDYFDTRTVVFAVAWLLLGGIMLLPGQTRDRRTPNPYDRSVKAATEKSKT